LLFQLLDARAKEFGRSAVNLGESRVAPFLKALSARDIEKLEETALQKTFSLTKVSFRDSLKKSDGIEFQNLARQSKATARRGKVQPGCRLDSVQQLTQRMPQGGEVVAIPQDAGNIVSGYRSTACVGEDE
jgi:hypothetical protein